MSHRVTEDWLGEEVETLEDVLRPGLRAVCVGINPSPVSVAAGHYYQGRLGQAFFRRLAVAGAVPSGPGWDDDRAYADGIGFTDIVKRPTARAADLSTRDYSHGQKQPGAYAATVEVNRALASLADVTRRRQP